VKNIAAKIFAVILAIALLISIIAIPLTQCNKKTYYAQVLAESNSNPWMGILFVVLGLLITASAFIYMYRTMKKNKAKSQSKINSKRYQRTPKDSKK